MNTTFFARSSHLALALFVGIAASCSSDRLSITDPAGVNGSESDARAIVYSVTVTPGSAAGNVGDSAQFKAVARSRFGAIITGRVVTWTTTDANVVTVSPTGM